MLYNWTNRLCAGYVSAHLQIVHWLRATISMCLVVVAGSCCRGRLYTNMYFIHMYFINFLAMTFQSYRQSVCLILLIPASFFFKLLLICRQSLCLHEIFSSLRSLYQTIPYQCLSLILLKLINRRNYKLHF